MQKYTVVYMVNGSQGSYPAMLQRIRHVEAPDLDALKRMLDDYGIDPCCLMFNGWIAPEGFSCVRQGLEW